MLLATTGVLAESFTITQVTNNTLISDRDPKIDGDFIVWTGRVQEGMVYTQEIYLHQISTGSTSQLTNDAAIAGNVQNDGNYVVWDSDVDGDFEIYLHEISTSTTIQVTSNDAVIQPHKFSVIISFGKGMQRVLGLEIMKFT